MASDAKPRPQGAIENRLDELADAIAIQGDGSIQFNKPITAASGTTNVAALICEGDAEVDGSFRTSPTTPASASATGVTGTIAHDTGFIYICTATNTWKRVAIATW